MTVVYQKMHLDKVPNFKSFISKPVILNFLKNITENGVVHKNVMFINVGPSVFSLFHGNVLQLV